MARIKQKPTQRNTTDDELRPNDLLLDKSSQSVTKKQLSKAQNVSLKDNSDPGVLQLAVAVGGIYASFLTWAFLQERLTTTRYGSESNPEVFRYPVFLNTIQSAFAATTGLIYLYISTPRGRPVPAVIPSRQVLIPLCLVATTTALASPFGYASLAHIDYITFLLAKSCKLLPVMFLHITLFRKRYPMYKYLVVAAVTAGVAVFTVHSGSKKKQQSVSNNKSAPWGILLLSINLLFDGLTNSVQDYIFTAHQPYTGPQMMAANNILSTIFTSTYLLISPWLANTIIGEYLNMKNSGASGELAEALSFMARHPSVWRDVLGFSMFGAVGQVFIFYTLSTFSSVLLVTVTVTRKMFTMILSVLAFGHHLTKMQWAGVGLVFGGIGIEALIQRREKIAKELAKKSKSN
ncbi:UDP-galactose transporter -like protein 1 [Ceratocystis lukuohia]|uniref:UDP-galactose transporter homolog 1 n=1 Tax=Ceratocystis lukuohia TaxID=2019550 RepID=A0ABR4MB90_9PEZI